MTRATRGTETRLTRPTRETTKTTSPARAEATLSKPEAAPRIAEAMGRSTTAESTRKMEMGDIAADDLEVVVETPKPGRMRMIAHKVEGTVLRVEGIRLQAMRLIARR